MAAIGASAASPAGKTLPLDTLMDKIKGGWAGQTIGCTYGGPTEFYYRGRTIADTVAIDWPEHYISWYFQKSPGLYDDVYMDLTFVDVFRLCGLDAPVEEFAKAFAYAPYPLWHANLQGRVNIMAGIMPPQSGHWKNNPHADDIDFQIEADYAGLMSPGLVNAASHYCDEIGHIMNYGDGWYGGVWVAAMYSLAFIHDDIETIVTKSLEVLPPQSRYYQCIDSVIKWHRMYPDDWRKTWARVQEELAVDSEANCPQEIGAPFRIDADINGAYIAIGLLYGGGDFEKTMDIATRCGQDSDCNPASACGILATMKGYSSIPEKYLADVREVEDIPFQYTDISLNKAYQMSYDQALEVLKRNGAKIGKKSVFIPSQEIVPVRYEKSFEGVRFKEAVIIDRGAWGHGNSLDLEFDGNGIVLCGYLAGKNDGDYEAIVDVRIDGQWMPSVKINEKELSSPDHIYHNFDLGRGHHKVHFHVRNPREDKKLRYTRALIYDRAAFLGFDAMSNEHLKDALLYELRRAIPAFAKEDPAFATRMRELKTSVEQSFASDPYAWMNLCYAWCNAMEQKYPPVVSDPALHYADLPSRRRAQILKILDYPYHEVSLRNAQATKDGDTRYYSDEQSQRFYKATYEYNNLRREAMLQALREPLKEGECQVIKVYSSGYIFRTKDHCMAADICYRRCFNNIGSLEDLVDAIDILFTSHPHDDHYDVDLWRMMALTGKPMMHAYDIDPATQGNKHCWMKGDSQRAVLEYTPGRVQHETIDLRGGGSADVTAVHSVQGRVPLLIYRAECDGWSFLHFADSSDKDSWEALVDSGANAPHFVFSPQDTPRVLDVVRRMPNPDNHPVYYFTTHENEYEHSVCRRAAYRWLLSAPHCLGAQDAAAYEKAGIVLIDAGESMIFSK